jgi:hypothetical protein
MGTKGMKLLFAALVALLGINIIPSIAQAVDTDAAVPYAQHLSCAERCKKDDKGTFNEETGVCTPADAEKHPYRSFDKCEVLAYPPACPDKDKDGYPDFACGGKKADNCVKDANGPAQAGIKFIGDQTDSDGDGIGDACDGATEAWVRAELEARAGAAMEILAQLGDRKQDQLEAMAALREAIEGGGIVNINDLNRALRPLYVAVDCFNQGRVASFSTFDGQTRVTCVEDPWRVAKDKTDARQDDATLALERRAATGELGLYAGGTVGDDSFGLAAPQVALVVRPSPHVHIRAGAAVGLPLGVSEANIAASLFASVDAANVFYHSAQCQIGIGGGGRYTTALGDDFGPHATALGVEAGVPLVCGQMSIRIDAGAARAATNGGRGALPTVGGNFALRF